MSKEKNLTKNSQFACVEQFVNFCELFRAVSERLDVLRHLLGATLNAENLIMHAA